MTSAASAATSTPASRRSATIPERVIDHVFSDDHAHGMSARTRSTPSAVLVSSSPPTAPTTSPSETTSIAPGGASTSTVDDQLTLELLDQIRVADAPARAASPTESVTKRHAAASMAGA